MSSGDRRFVIHDSETYRLNQQRIEQAQKIVDTARETNEQARRNYQEIEAELLRKMQEGQQAQQMLMSLQQNTKQLLTLHDPTSSALASSAPVQNHSGSVEPGFARIEEVSSPNRPSACSDTSYQANHAGPSHQPQQNSAGLNYQPQQLGYQPPNYQPQQYQQQPQQYQQLGQDWHQQQFATQMITPRHSATLPYVQNPTPWHDPQSTGYQQPTYSQPQYAPTVTQQSPDPGPPPGPARVLSGVRPQAPFLHATTPPVQSQSRAPSESHPFGTTSQLDQPQSRPSPQPYFQQTQSQASRHVQRQPTAEPNQHKSHSAVSHQPVQPQADLRTRTPRTKQGPVQSTSRQAFSRAASHSVNSAPPKSTAGSAPTPSYGLSPFAHVPASTAPTASAKSNSRVVAAPEAAASTSQVATKPSAQRDPKVVANGPVFSSLPQPSVSTSRIGPPANASGGALSQFLSLINMWQKCAADNASLDIPSVETKLFKRPLGEIHFFRYEKGSRATRVSAQETFNRLVAVGTPTIFTIFTSPNGLPMLLMEPLPPHQAATYKRFWDVPVKGAPDASFPEPPSAPTQPHDVLKALGKGDLYAAEEDSVRYAKRRAVEVPFPVPVPVPVPAPAPSVVHPVRSENSTVKTTPRPFPVVEAPRIPLFLPASPAPSSSTRKSPAKDKAPASYVLVPPAPEYVKRYRERMRTQQDQEVEENRQQPEKEEQLEIDEAEWKRRRALGMYQNTENEEEAAGMLEAFSRIGEVACKWNSCAAVLNSSETLIAHLHATHAQETNEHFTCMWDLCGEVFSDYRQLGMHAETHVLENMSCAHLGCDETFSTASELVAHNRGHTERNLTKLKPSTRPTVPQGPLINPELPEAVLDWALFVPAVGMPSISEARHAELGPWVLRHIHAKVNVRAKRYNAAKPPDERAKQCDENDFEFLQPYARAKHYSTLPSYPAKLREMMDLNSKEVSDLIANGHLVLWPPGGKEHQVGVEETQLASEHYERKEDEELETDMEQSKQRSAQGMEHQVRTEVTKLAYEHHEDEEDELSIDVEEWKRRRALGMYQNTENEAEAAAMLEAFSRIDEVVCKWNSCAVVLNSFESLVAHLCKIHAQETNEHFTCMWNLCGKVFSDQGRLGIHAEKHVLATIRCAYMGCETTFPTASQLVVHNLSHVKQNLTELRPSTRPALQESPANPEVPETVSDWALFAPGVGMPSIPQARHAELGPWVLRHIYPKVPNMRATRYNAAEPDFEFLQTYARSRNYSTLPSVPAKVREMRDLKSKDVSDWVAKGHLVLWPQGEIEHHIGTDPANSEHMADEELVVENMLAAP